MSNGPGGALPKKKKRETKNKKKGKRQIKNNCNQKKSTQ